MSIKINRSIANTRLHRATFSIAGMRIPALAFRLNSGRQASIANWLLATAIAVVAFLLLI